MGSPKTKPEQADTSNQPPAPAPAYFPPWRNWQTQPLCMRPTLLGFVGSSPTGGTFLLLPAPPWGLMILNYIGMNRDEKQPKKRGPKEDRLIIETDPDDALDKLLGKEPEKSDDDDAED